MLIDIIDSCYFQKCFQVKNTGQVIDFNYQIKENLIKEVVKLER